MTDWKEQNEQPPNAYLAILDRTSYCSYQGREQVKYLITFIVGVAIGVVHHYGIEAARYYFGRKEGENK